jgi:hypothetical protein
MRCASCLEPETHFNAGYASTVRWSLEIPGDGGTFLGTLHPTSTAIRLNRDDKNGYLILTANGLQNEHVDEH